MLNIYLITIQCSVHYFTSNKIKFSAQNLSDHDSRISWLKPDLVSSLNDHSEMTPQKFEIFLTLFLLVTLKQLFNLHLHTWCHKSTTPDAGIKGLQL